MTRFAIDAPTALRIVNDPRAVASSHSLVAPAVLRSHALSSLFRDTRAGRLGAKEARAQLEGIAGLKIRLLGDRVSRAVAFKIADELGWDDTPLAEYLAVASLQADVLVTDDPVLVAAADGIIPLAAFDDLYR